MNRTVLLAALTALTWAGPASAATTWHRRPYTAIRVIGGGYPDLFGASGSIYVPRPLVLEAGISRGVGNRGSWYTRGGPAFSLREKPTAKEIAEDLKYPDDHYPTFDVIVQPMGGFRWYETRTDDVRQTFAGPTFDTAVDVMMWVNAKTALDFQVSIGGSYWIEKSDADALPFTPDVHLALGFAF